MVPYGSLWQPTGFSSSSKLFSEVVMEFTQLMADHGVIFFLNCCFLRVVYIKYKGEQEGPEENGLPGRLLLRKRPALKNMTLERRLDKRDTSHVEFNNAIVATWSYK